MCVRLPGWAASLFFPALILFLILNAATGFYLQGYAVKGHVAQSLFGAAFRSNNIRPGRIRFARMADSRRTPLISELRRRADLERSQRLELGSLRTAGRLLAGIVEPRWVTAAKTGRGAVSTPQTTRGGLLWPVPQGWYVRGYGSGENGYHLAVDIAGERGSDVISAASGIVGYAGDKVRGYGKLIIVIHPGGWITAYAHNRKNLVVAGERVAAGQLLAELGNSGISRGPHLHFELIYGGRMCDPVPLFRPGVRHRGGRHFAKAMQWDPGSKPPSAVRCDPRRHHPRSLYYAMHPQQGEIGSE